MPESSKASPAIDGALINSLMTNVFMKAAAGSLAFIPALVLFRGAGMRCLCGGMGVGFGAGVAWTQGDLHLRHPELVPLPSSFLGEMTRLQDTAKERYMTIRSRLGI